MNDINSIYDLYDCSAAEDCWSDGVHRAEHDERGTTYNERCTTCDVPGDARLPNFVRTITGDGGLSVTAAKEP